MTQTIKLKCINPTSSLTKGKIYMGKRAIKESGIHSTHFVDWSEATHILVRNDKGETIRTLATRFEKANEQKEGQATAKG